MKKLTFLMALALAVVLALPGVSTEAAPTDEVKKLTASDAQADDQFGGSVAVSGDTAVVGAEYEDGVGNSRGAAYVFERDQGGADNWGEVTKLTASDAQADDQFGWSVAVSGDTAVVGAYQEDAGGSQAGAAYVFQQPVAPVGGLAELPDVAGSSGPNYAVLAALAGLALVALTAGAWYARRRWLG